MKKQMNKEAIWMTKKTTQNQTKIKLNPEVQERIQQKLQKRIEEEEHRLKKIEKDDEEKQRQDTLLKCNICPMCGGDAKKVFSLFHLVDFRKIKCKECGFSKTVYFGIFDGGNYY